MKICHSFKAVFIFPIYSSVALLTGCTHMIQPPKTPFTDYPENAKLPLKVAVNLTDELRKTTKERHSLGDTWAVSIGPWLADNVPILAKHTFSDVVEVNNGALPPKLVDAILTPKVAYINQTVGANSGGESIISIKVEWLLGDLSGNVIWLDTIAGQCSGYTGSSHPEANLKKALEDMLRNSQREVLTSQAIRHFSENKYPNVVTAPYKTDTIERMRDAQDAIDRLALIGAERKPDPKIERLCKDLQSQNTGTVMTALKELRVIDAPEAVPQILPCLKSSEAHVIRDACRTLAVLGKKEIIPFIEPLLDDSREDVRKDAEDAIAALKSK